VAANYDIDGIHFDDYFYPNEALELFNDKKSYKKHNLKYLTKEDWRRDNINEFVKKVSYEIKTLKKFMKFGVSPISVWRHINKDPRGSNTFGGQSAYDDLYADIRLWLKNDWIDYVIPQLYHRIGHRFADFRTLEKWWNDNSFGKHVYTGHALYKLVEGNEKGWDTPNELINQFKINRNNSKSKGIALYRSWSYFQNPWGIRDSLKHRYFKEYTLPPQMNWIDSIPALLPLNFKVKPFDKFVKLEWNTPPKAVDGDLPTHYLIYKFNQGDVLNFENKYLLKITQDTSYIDIENSNGGVFYVIKSLDRLKNESKSFLGEFFLK